MKADKNMYLFTGKVVPAPKVPKHTMEHMHRTLDAIEAELSPEQVRRVARIINDIAEVK